MTTARGLAPSVWRAVLQAAPAADLDPLLQAASVTVIAAHPDDETLGVAGVLQRLASAGVPVRLVVVTDGEAAYGSADPVAGRALGLRRRSEVRAALAAVGHADIDIVFAGLPDGGLAEQPEQVRAVLAGVDDRRSAWLVPWIGDPHPDHRAVGQAALAVAGAHRVWQYPVWLRHGLRPDDERADAGAWQVMRLTPEERRAKDAAVHCHDSQVRGPAHPGDEVGPVLPDHVLALFADGMEPLLPAASPLDARQRFADAYAASADPFGVRTRWYERRKLAVVLASLPRERYAQAWEPACGIGELTAELSGRCDVVHAQDPSITAVQAVQNLPGALATGRGRVEVSTGSLPGDVPVPAGSVQLVVVSEVLYYLSAADREATIAAARTALAPGGDLVLVHWRDWPEDAWVSGDAAHAAVRRIAGETGAWEPVARHVDEQFVVDVLRRR